MSDPVVDALMGEMFNAGAAPQPPAAETPGKDDAVVMDVLADVYGSDEAAYFAMTGKKAPPKKEEQFFFNPQTGQMTSRETMKGYWGVEQGRGDAAIETGAHGATLGTSDEAAWVAGRLADGPDMAKAMLESQRAKIGSAREKYPWQSLGTEMLGGAAVPATIYNDARQAASLGGAMVKGAKGGAGAGGLYAMGEAEGGVADRLLRAPEGMAAGAVGGALQRLFRIGDHRIIRPVPDYRLLRRW